MSRKHICWITTGHISSNPRLVKEISAICNEEFELTVLYCQNVKRLLKYDNEIEERYQNVKFIRCRYTNDRYTLYKLLTAIIQRSASIFHNFLSNLSPYYIHRGYFLQENKLKSISADLYIAHNLGALPLAAKKAKKAKSKYAFDAEDFHSGESDNQKINSIKSAIEANYLSKAAYISAASPLIAQKYKTKYNLLQPIPTILNVFQKKMQPFFKENKLRTKLKLIWFSQTIGLDRGIQDILDALISIPNIPIQIDLLGDCTTEVEEYFRMKIRHNNHQLNILSIRSEQELIELCSNYDIGLALERKTPMNRNICLTNKIFTYILSGIAVLASDTDGQKQFLKQYPQIGQLYTAGDIKAIEQVLSEYWNNKELLYLHRKNTYLLGNTKLNWESEQTLFLSSLYKAL